MGKTLYTAAFWVYLAATLCYLVHMIRECGAVGKTGTGLVGLGLALQAVAIVSRGAALGRIPFLNLYEYLLMFTFCAAAVYMVVERLARNRSFGAFAVPLITLMVYFGMALPGDAEPTVPALRSAWRTPHIGTAILAYAAFALAFCISFVYLVREKAGEAASWASRLPKLEMIDKLNYRVIAFGFLMQTAMLITGSVWAQIAWGRYWSWDPKETFALITWLIYAAYLHTRTTMGWRGRRSAVLSLVGFVAVIFTLLGVNYLGGLHAYSGIK